MLVSGAQLGVNTIRQILNGDDKLRSEVAVIGGSIKSYPRPEYNSIRGILSEKGNLDNTLLFQFNPTQITDSKTNEYGNTSDFGFQHADPRWVKGGDKIISFNLFFDATAGSNTSFLKRQASPGNPTYDTLDYVKPRGTLEDIQKLQSFQYPVVPDPNQPRFSSGGIVPSPRFYPPPIVIFVYGELYLECVVQSATVTHNLYNSKLQPVRSEVSVSLKILESELAQQDDRLKNYSKTTNQGKLIA